MRRLDMTGKSIKFYLRGGNIIFVPDLTYTDLIDVAEAVNLKCAIHVGHVHIAPDEVVYYEEL